MRRFSLTPAVSLLLLSLLLNLPAHGQLYTGSISGTVADATGAVVVGAKVIATDVEKGFTFPGTTDKSGHYILRNIPPATYYVTVEAPGFQKERKDGVVIAVNLNATIDFKLQVGATSQTVEVQSQAVELQTQDAVTGQVIGRRAINSLPLVGRDVLQLTFLAPGIVSVAEAANNDENFQEATGVNFNSNGGRNGTADLLVDGASISNIEQNGGTNAVLRAPPVDSIEEFKVQQTNFSAEFGFAGGTVINAVTRSGTNAFHGSLHEFWRNQILDANDWFANANGTPIPPLRRNQFGGTFGGPIRKNKTFFFFDFDGLRLRNFTANSGGVPTLCERGDPSGLCPFAAAHGGNALGNFEETCTQGSDPISGAPLTFNALGQCISTSPGAGETALQGGASGQLWDPFSGLSTVNTTGRFATRQTFIPFNNLSTYTSASLPGGAGNLIDPLSRKLFLLFPKPNTSTTPTFQGGTNFAFAGVTPSSDNTWDIKIDHHFNDKNLLSVKYSQDNFSSNTANCYGNIADPCSVPGPTIGHTYLLAVNYTKTFTPNVLMSLTYGGARNFSYSQGIGANVGFNTLQNDLNSLFSLPGQSCSITSPSAAQCFGAVGLEEGGKLFDAVPNIVLAGTYSSPGLSGTFGVIRQGQDTQSLADTVSWLRGKHEFKFGGEFRVARDNYVQPGAPAGQFNFSYIGTAQFSDAGIDGTNATGAPADGGDDLASMLVGVGDPLNGTPPPSGCFNGTGGCFRGFNNFVSTQNWRYAWFVNDNFHATPKLTLNLGVRYELSLPRTERFNRMESLDASKLSAIQYNAAQLAMINAFNSTPLVAGNPATTPNALGIPSPTTLHGAEVFAGVNGASRYTYNPYYGGIQPRIGLAWQLPHNAVLRAGYGIFYDAARSAASGTGPVGFDGFDIQPPWLTVNLSPAQVANQVPCGRLSNPNANPTTGCNVTNIAFPQPPGNTLGAFNNLGFGANGPIPIINSKIPYEQSWSVGLQKELPSKILLDMNYIGKKGTHLYAGGFNSLQLLGRPFEQAVLSGKLSPSDLNTINSLVVTNPFDAGNFGVSCSSPTNPNYICSDGSAEGSLASTIGATQLLSPFPQFASFGGDAFPVADSTYHALQVRAERSFANGLEFLVTYTWSKSIDNSSFQDFSNQFLGNGGGSTSLQDPFNPRGDRAVSVFDIPQVFQFSYVYEFPLGRGKAFGSNLHPILNAIVGGWQTSGIWTISDGRPLVLLGSNASIPTYGQRPNLSAPLKRSSTSYQKSIATTNNPNPVSYFSNPGVLTVAPDFTFGNAPRTTTSVLSPGTRNSDLALFKEFPLAKVHEGMRLEFRAEANNALNHPQFVPPDTDAKHGTYGQIVPSNVTGKLTVNGPRELQLGLKLYF